MSNQASQGLTNSEKEHMLSTFENGIKRQEDLVKSIVFQFDDETDEQFTAKIERRLKLVCLGIGSSWDFPGINCVCPGADAIWEGYKVMRRRVDHLDNIYVCRA